MITPQEAIDFAKYENPGEALPEIMGHNIGEALRITEYIRICPLPEYVDKEYIEGSPGELKLPANYDHCDMQLVRSNKLQPDAPLEGFVRGFPLLESSEGVVPSVHIHEFLDDIYSSSYFVPLREIAEVYLYSELFADLLGHSHEMQANSDVTSERFSVPLLLDNKSDSMIYRRADQEDLKIARGYYDVPTQILGVGAFSPIEIPNRPVGFKM